ACRPDAPCLHAHDAIPNHLFHLLFAARRFSTGDSIYSPRLNLAELSSRARFRKAWLRQKMQRGIGSRAYLRVQPRDRRADSPRAFSSSASARAAEDGSAVAEIPRAHSRGDSHLGGCLAAFGAALPRR